VLLYGSSGNNLGDWFYKGVLWEEGIANDRSITSMRHPDFYGISDTFDANASARFVLKLTSSNNEGVFQDSYEIGLFNDKTGI
jgi:hypothetical protein